MLRSLARGYRSGLLTFCRSQHVHSIANCGAFTNCGGKPFNEDRFMIAEVGPWSVAAVMDGHGGDFAVDHVAKGLLSVLTDLIEQYHSPPLIFPELFSQLQAALSTAVANSSNPRAISCGTTATVCVFNDQTLHIGHCGDSRAVLCVDGQLKALTIDHRPEYQPESDRIEAAGGKISYRGGMPRVNGDLNMTRALGAFHLQDVGLTYEPDIVTQDLSSGDETFLLLATDGLFDVVQDNEIVYLAQQAETPSEAAQTIGDLSLAYGATDNVTLVLAPLAGWRKRKDAKTKEPFPNRNLIRRTS
eukprot:TRINITY_DN6931_c0_g2_i1.p1 TRINITY_DN6931_c0_g2~~TRINITY_DN6931_c0_g2_i1.p1  ORF type:complete len:302 (+),score=29.59 TRINITY_DN6931_c0_g2_i1:48-953(+)